MSIERLMTEIEQTISKNGGNKHDYPFTFGQHKGTWSVVIEIDSRTRTFDVEAEHPSLAVALKSALGQLRRQYAHPGR